MSDVPASGAPEPVPPAGGAGADSAAGARGSDRLTAAGVSRRMREILSGGEYRTEGHRKAALRRVLHQAAAGMDAAGLAAFVGEVKARFPDRVFEADARARQLEGRQAALEAELAALRTEREALDKRARAAEKLLGRLYEALDAALPGAPAGVVGGSVAQLPGDPEALARFAGALSRIISFAIDQESTAASVEETLGRTRSGSGREALPALVKRLTAGGGKPGEDQAELERRLRRMRLLPAALLAGAQQSWKGGTRGILEYLDPKAAEAEIPARLPGLREAAVLKEVRRRYEQFWDELDKNIAHFYRGTFEKVYSEKMEGRA